MTRLCLRHRESDDLPRACGFERVCRFAERRAGGRDVIKQDDVLPENGVRPDRRKTADDIAVPLGRACGLGLRFRVATPHQDISPQIDGRRSVSRRAISSAWLNPRSFRRRRESGKGIRINSFVGIAISTR